MTPPTELEAALNSAYTERSALLAWILSSTDLVLPEYTCLAPAPDVDALSDPGWYILYARTKLHHQVTWHISPADLDLFPTEYYPRVPADSPYAVWDGHTTGAKYLRIEDDTETNNQLRTHNQAASTPLSSHIILSGPYKGATVTLLETPGG